MSPMGEQEQEQNDGLPIEPPLRGRGRGRRQRPRILLLIVVLVLCLVLCLVQIIRANNILSAPPPAAAAAAAAVTVTPAVTVPSNTATNTHDNDDRNRNRNRNRIHNDNDNDNSSNAHDEPSSSSSSSSSDIISFTFPTVQERVRYYMASWYYKSNSDEESKNDNENKNKNENKNENKNKNGNEQSSSSSLLGCSQYDYYYGSQKRRNNNTAPPRRKMRMYQPSFPVDKSPYLYNRKAVQEAHNTNNPRNQDDFFQDALTLVFPRLQQQQQQSTTTTTSSSTITNTNPNPSTTSTTTTTTITNKDNDNALLLIHFGDTKELYEWPVLVKTRPIIIQNNNNDNNNNNNNNNNNDNSNNKSHNKSHKKNNLQLLPILLPLDLKRHFGKIRPLLPKQQQHPTLSLPSFLSFYYEKFTNVVVAVAVAIAVVAWEDKKEKVVWRGASTGFGDKRRSRILQAFLFPKEEEKEYSSSNSNFSNSNSNGTGTGTGTMRKRSNRIDEDIYRDIDIGLSKLVQGEDKDDATNRILLKPPMSQTKLLRYKYLLSLEGNDVASGLKWMLYSNSVVFMPLPTISSWAMEDRLVPYYHYIPLKSDLSDLPSQLQWAKNHDAECHQISRQATQYMQDLWTSPQAQRDTEEILKVMIGRYQALYGNELQECANQEEYRYSHNNYVSTTTD